MTLDLRPGPRAQRIIDRITGRRRPEDVPELKPAPLPRIVEIETELADLGAGRTDLVPERVQIRTEQLTRELERLQSFEFAPEELPVVEEPLPPSLELTSIPGTDLTLNRDFDLIFKEYQRTGGQLDVTAWIEAGTPFRPEGEFAVTELPLGVEPERLTNTIIAVFPSLTVDEFSSLINEDPDLFWNRIREGGFTSEKSQLLTLMGYTPEEIETIIPAEDLTLQEIPPDGLSFTVNDENGIPVEFVVQEDFEFVGTERTLKSNELIVFHEGREVGRIDYETGEFTPTELSFWQRLGVGAATVLEKIFIPVSFVGAGIGFLGEEFKRRAEMTPEEWEALQASGLPVASLSDFQKFLPGGEYHERLQNSPFWVRLGLELPFWYGVIKGGVSATRAIRSLDRAAAEGLIPKQMAVAGRVVLEATTIPTQERILGFVVGTTTELTYRTLMSASLRRNLRSWGASTGREISKEAEDAFVESALRELSPRFLGREAVRTLFKPTKGGFTATKAGAREAERAAGEAVRRAAPKLIGEATPRVTPTAVPLVITETQKASLRALGHTEEAIAQMTPQQAQEILGITPEVTEPVVEGIQSMSIRELQRRAESPFRGESKQFVEELRRRVLDAVPITSEEVLAMTRAEFIENNAELVVKATGRFGTTHFELKTQVGDYQKAWQITGDTSADILGKLYGRFAEAEVAPVEGVTQQAGVPLKATGTTGILKEAITPNKQGLVPEGGSETITAILEGDNAGVSDNLGNRDVTDRMIANAQRQIADITRASLDKRGLPDEFTVWRGGEVRGVIVPVTLSESTARMFAGFSQGRDIIQSFRVKKSDVLADIEALTGPGEAELLIHRDNLTKPQVTPEVTQQLKDLGWTDAQIQELDAQEISSIIRNKQRPTLFEEVLVTEPVEGVATKGLDVEESIPPETINETTPALVDGTIVVHDLNVIDRFRPSRKVFEKMGLFDIWQSAFKSETLKAEEQVAFSKELNKHAKAVGRDIARRELVWEFVNNSNQKVFNQLTFQEKQAALWWKRTADDWANRLNIPQAKRIKDYIPHIFDEAASQAKDLPIDASFSMVFSKKITDKVKMPFLEKRLGKELGLVKDPFLAAQAYQNVALRKFYYEPILQQLKLVSEHETTPEFARNYLKDYSRRMTGEPATIDKEINKLVNDVANNIRGLPGGETLANFLTRGNPSTMAAYNLTSALYVMWLGFKPTTAIRNLSQHGLIIAEVDSIQDFGNGIRLRFTPEGRKALEESLVVRSRRGAFIESIDSSVTSKLADDVRETALFLFRKADEQNVKDAFLSGYAEAKRLYPEAGRDVRIKRGDEVAADTQYLYTKMNSLAISQNGPGKVLAMLTTWAINWLELMNKFARGRPSRVYQQLVESDPVKFKAIEKNWLTSRISLLTYMAIVGIAYGLTEQDWNRVRAFEYTGFTSINTFANLIGGEFPGLELPGAVADIIAGTLLGNERDVTTGWNNLKRSFSILNQLERVASGEREWLSLFFYLEGKNHQVRKLKEDWEKNWKPYDDLADPIIRGKMFPTINRSTAQKRWREQNPKIEAQMFITNRLGTLSSDEARAEVLRLIDKHNIDIDVINGYEKIFGVDTTEELQGFQDRIGNLEKFVIGEEAKYFTVSNFLTKANDAVKINGRDKVERDGHPFTVFLLGEQDSWQPYDDYDNADARRLYRQLNPDVEASLYLAGKIGSFENPESVKILLGIMDKYDIPPQAVNAFNQNPDKYDELFTPKFELEQKSFELTTQFENLGNSEAPNFIENTEERRLAREQFKMDNWEWWLDQTRIEAIDKDVPLRLDGMKGTEAWVDRENTVRDFGDNSAEASTWLIDHPETYNWAIEQKLLTDRKDELAEREPILRIDVKWREQDEAYEAILDENDRVQAQKREAYLNANFEYSKQRRVRDALGIRHPNDFFRKFPSEHIDNYVKWYTGKSLEKPDDWTLDVWYEDDWFLMENPEFHDAMVDFGVFTERRDFKLVPPTRELGAEYIGYKRLLAKDAPRIELDKYRLALPNMDRWGVSVGIWETTMTERRRRLGLTPSERFQEDLERKAQKAAEELRELK